MFNICVSLGCVLDLMLGIYMYFQFGALSLLESQAVYHEFTKKTGDVPEAATHSHIQQ